MEGDPEVEEGRGERRGGHKTKSPALPPCVTLLFSREKEELRRRCNEPRYCC